MDLVVRSRCKTGRIGSNATAGHSGAYAATYDVVSHRAAARSFGTRNPQSCIISDAERFETWVHQHTRSSTQIGPYGTGILYLERDAKHPFTEQEGQLLAIVGASLALTLRNADSYQRLQDVVLQDSLTGVLNRHGFNTPLAQELKAGLRYGVPACLILLDFDFFQTVNDRLGHKIGDHMLRSGGRSDTDDGA